MLLDFDDVLGGAIASAETEWEGFRIERIEFAERLRSLVGESENPAEALAKVHVTDLYLAHGCLLGVAGAVRAFASKYLARIETYLQRFHSMRAVRAFGDDVRRLVEDQLLVARGDAPPRIGQYRGTGPLEGFVAKTAIRVAVSLLRQKGQEEPRDVESLLTVSPEAARGLVRARYASVVRDAVRASVAALDPRQRTILRLYLAKGISFTQIARMLKLHQTTVSRGFEATIRQLEGDVRRRLRQHGLRDAEMNSIVRDVRSQIDLSLSRDFRDNGSVS